MLQFTKEEAEVRNYFPEFGRYIQSKLRLTKADAEVREMRSHVAQCAIYVLLKRFPSTKDTKASTCKFFI